MDTLTDNDQTLEEAPKTVEESTVENIEPGEVHEGEVIPPINLLDGFSAIASMLNGKSKVMNDYSELATTLLKLFEENDEEHTKTNKSIKFIAENIDSLISQLNKYKKSTEMKLRLLFLMNVVTWIALFIKVF